MEEAKHEKTETGETTAAHEEEWQTVPIKKKKNREGQQPGNERGGQVKSANAHEGAGRGVRGTHQAHSPVDEELKKKWEAAVEELKPKVVRADDFDWSLHAALVTKHSPETQAPQGQTPSNSWSKVLFGGPQRSQVASPQTTSTKPLSLIGGIHLSYYKNNPRKKDWAIASLVVCSFPGLEVVHEALKEVHVQAPFISGFFSFRDVEPLVALFNELKETKPELVPQIILVDGPGVAYKGFGLATHLGVLLGVPTVGVTKKFFNVDGLNEGSVRKFAAAEAQKRGEAIEIIGRSGDVLAAAMRTSEGPKGHHIYISIGHRISLPTAVEVVREASTRKVPQPVYFAEHKVKQELLKSDPKSKATGNAGNKNAGGNKGPRNNKGGNNRREGGKEGGFGNGKVQDGKGQGKRPRGPKGPREGGQGEGRGPRPQGQGQGQGGQGKGRQGGQGGQGGNKGPRPQGQQGGQQQGGQGKKTGGSGGGRGGGGNNRAVGNSPKGNNVWTQKVPAGGAGGATAQPAAQPQSPPAAAQQERPAGGAGKQNKGGGGGQGKPKKQQQPQQHGEKSVEKQQQSAAAQPEKKD